MCRQAEQKPDDIPLQKDESKKMSFNRLRFELHTQPEVNPGCDGRFAPRDSRCVLSYRHLAIGIALLDSHADAPKLSALGGHPQSVFQDTGLVYSPAWSMFASTNSLAELRLLR